MHSGRRAYDGTHQDLLVRNPVVRWHPRADRIVRYPPREHKGRYMGRVLYPKGIVHLRQFRVCSASFRLFPLIFICRNRFILRDPRLWDDPDTFHPERFLGKERPPFDPLSVVFGFGRRSVPAPVNPHQQFSIFESPLIVTSSLPFCGRLACAETAQEDTWPIDKVSSL